jgi:formate dehydrogenase iron-sulfur subunit
MSKGFFVDTTLCTACRACQIACKQWHNLPAEETKNWGSYQNPPDLSFDTYKLVRMQEEEIDGKLRWLFFPDQCRHCVDAPCLATAGTASAVYKEEHTGAILYTAQTKGLPSDDIIASCPYNIPRKSDDGTLAKCDMCIDRVLNGWLPACVKTCPTGAMNFGALDDMKALAQKRLAEVKEKFPAAQILDAESVRVIYLTAFDPLKYNKNAIASARPFGINRQMALRKMFNPFMTIARL